jgi:hypothetical protein
LCQAYPEPEDSVASKEGTAAHWAAAQVLNGGIVDVGQIADNGVMLTEEMLEAVDIYTEDVQEVQRRTGAYLAVEKRVDISTIHEENWGTPDSWLFDQKGGEIFIWDFKFGHRYVEVYENWQMIDYLEGIIDFLDINGAQDDKMYATITLVQPRNYSPEGPIRRWRVRLDMLRGHFNALRMAAEKALGENPQCTPNPECVFCSARHVCPALQKAALTAVDQSTQSVPVELTPEALGLELQMIKRALGYLKARETGLEEQAISTFKGGKSVPRFAMRPTEGRLVWSKPISQVVDMGKMMQVNVGKEAAITPKQAMKAGLPEAVVLAYASRESGALALVPDDGTQANKIFK